MKQNGKDRNQNWLWQCPPWFQRNQNFFILVVFVILIVHVESFSQSIRSTTRRRSTDFSSQLFSTVSPSSSSSSSSTNNNPNSNKKTIIRPNNNDDVNRRKSPALWREDLQQQSTAKTKDYYRPSLHNRYTDPPELMSPAGGMPQLLAAIANGADSIYIGLSSFSARARATNFRPNLNSDDDNDDDELRRAVEICHSSNVRLYVALNTLVFNSEFTELETLIHHCDKVGVDALIVQDIGLSKLIQEVAPFMEIHASTQQSITSAYGATFSSLVGGSHRVVVGRELSLDDIYSIASQFTPPPPPATAAAGSTAAGTVDAASDTEVADAAAADADAPALHPNSVEIEAFVHGALCVSYSGQCFSSEAWGGRSANRGQCAQACRLPYGLIVNGQLKNILDQSYVLSPQDLCGLDHVETLIRNGVRCLKIEGRLKDSNYVAATTRAYRKAIDDAWYKLTGQWPKRQRQYPVSSSSSSFAPQKSHFTKQKQNNKNNNNGKKELQQDNDNDTDTTQSSSSSTSIEVVNRIELAQLFSRGQDSKYDGLSSGFFLGSQHQSLVRGRSPRHRGIHLGFVGRGTNSQRNELVIILGSEENIYNLKRGDGIVIDCGNAQEFELGGPIYDIIHTTIDDYDNDNDDNHYYDHRLSGNDKRRNKSQSKQQQQQKQKQQRHCAIVKFGRDVERQWNQYGTNITPIGAHVWKTSDPTLERKMKRLANADLPKRFATLRVVGYVGEPLRIEIRDVITGLVGKGQSSSSSSRKQGDDEDGEEREYRRLELAKTEGGVWTMKSIRSAVGLLGNTRWTIQRNNNDDDDNMDNVMIDVSELQEGIWCPASWIKEARRHAVEDLEQQWNTTRTRTSSSLEKGGGGDGDGSVAQRLLEDASMISSSSNSFQKSTTKTKTTTKVSNIKQPKLSILARTYEQVDAICTMIESTTYSKKNNDNNNNKTHNSVLLIDEIIVDFLEVDGMKEAISRIRHIQTPLRVIVASPRIIKPDEEGIWKTLLRLKPDALLIRSSGLLQCLISMGGVGAKVSLNPSTTATTSTTTHHDDDYDVVRIPELYGDFSLNVANALTAKQYLDAGLSRITASYDLSANAITDLARSMGLHYQNQQQQPYNHDDDSTASSSSSSSPLEVVIHTHLPIFHTEHCIFARFLTKGNSYHDCGHACTRHSIHLRDSSSTSSSSSSSSSSSLSTKDNLVLADMGCRNTIFASEAQSGVYSIQEWQTIGKIDRFRIELVDENPIDTIRVVSNYQDLFHGRKKPFDVWEDLKYVCNAYGHAGGITHGSYRNNAERRAGERVYE